MELQPSDGKYLIVFTFRDKKLSWKAGSKQISVIWWPLEPQTTGKRTNKCRCRLDKGLFCWSKSDRTLRTGYNHQTSLLKVVHNSKFISCWWLHGWLGLYSAEQTASPWAGWACQLRQLGVCVQIRYYCLMSGGVCAAPATVGGNINGMQCRVLLRLKPRRQ